jgi:hypothetical protein
MHDNLDALVELIRESMTPHRVPFDLTDAGFSWGARVETTSRRACSYEPHSSNPNTT